MNSTITHGRIIFRHEIDYDNHRVNVICELDASPVNPSLFSLSKKFAMRFKGLLVNPPREGHDVWRIGVYFFRHVCTTNGGLMLFQQVDTANVPMYQFGEVAS